MKHPESPLRVQTEIHIQRADIGIVGVLQKIASAPSVGPAVSLQALRWHRWPEMIQRLPLEEKTVHLWNWLINNSAAVQALTGCISLVLAILTSIVLVMAYRAARAQTEAARIQAAAALKQVESSERQMVVSEQQLAAARRGIDESVRPMIFIPSGAAAVAELTTVDIQNLGSGPAMEVSAAYARFGDREIDEYFVVPGTIVKGGSFPFTIDPDKVRKCGLLFLYQSLSGTSCVSEVTDVRPHFRYHPDAGDWIRAVRSRRR